MTTAATATATATATTNVNSYSLMSISGDVIIGTKMGTDHFVWFSRYFLWDCFLAPVLQVLRLSSSAKDNAIEAGELKVICVGYGRTGTFSLTKALDKLGYPTLHTQHLYRHYNIMKMWMKQVVEPSIEAESVMMGNPDWNVITQQGFEAIADFPASLYFEELAERYPNAKFILTTKGPGRSEDWFRSWEGMNQAALQSVYVAHRFLSQVEMYGKYFRWLIAHVNQDNVFLSKPFPIHEGQNKKSAIASYEAHNKLVRRTIPPERLLEYHLREGWEPLCRFLEVEACPIDEPFPQYNSALCKSFESLVAILYAVAVTSLLLFTFVAIVCRRFTGKSVVQWMKTRKHIKTEKLY